MENNGVGAMMEVVNKKTVAEISVSPVPIWVALIVGVLIGWSWRVIATGVFFFGVSVAKKFCRFFWTLLPGLDARRISLAFTAFSVLSVARQLWNWNGERGEREEAVAVGQDLGAQGRVADMNINHFTPDISEAGERVISKDDLGHFLQFLDGKTVWQHIMERSTSNLSYQAWRHEAEFGGIMYRSKTIFEEATPEMVRDFFWDDEFRPKWDTMLAYVKILEECPNTGMMIMHWIKKFPIFCKDREYIIGKRIWEAGRTYYCVTKGVPYLSLPICENSWRVDHYFSSWVIRAVQSRKGDGELSACEVTLIHYEDMGLPKHVTKFGVRHGMWGVVQKTHAGFRDYQSLRKASTSVSRYSLMASIMTRISTDACADIVEQVVFEERGEQASPDAQTQQAEGGFNWKWIVIGGTIALMCELHTGIIGNALFVGVGKRVPRRRGNHV